MPNTFQVHGAQPQKQVRFAPIYTNRFFTGIWTQRNPLRDAATPQWQEKYYGARGDALIDGQNVEISNRLTVARRAGMSVYNSASFSNVNRFYEFRLFDAATESIKVIVDTTTAVYDGTGPSTQTNIYTKATAGDAYFQSVGNVLYIGDGTKNQKWLQSLKTQASTRSQSLSLGGGFPQTFIIDPNGNVQQVTACIIPISNVQVAANVLTITANVALASPSVDLTKVLTVGQKVTFSAVVTAAFLNAQTVTIATVTSTTFTAAFTHANYGPSADTGTGTVVSGGTPYAGSANPTWSTTVPASGNNFAGGTTNDAFTQWTNRGLPLQNWGIADLIGAGAVAPTAVGTSSSSAWASNTFYSADGVIIDSNGGLQMVTTAGLSGTSTPAWQAAGAGVGGTTADGTVVWTKIQTAASLTWAAHTFYDTAPAAPALGTYITMNDSGGTKCLYKLVRGDKLSPAARPSIACAGAGTGHKLQASFWAGGVSTAFNGVIVGFSGLAGAPAATVDAPSLMFNGTWFTESSPNIQPLQFATLNQAGEVTAVSQPYAGATQNYLMAVYGQLYVPIAGSYSFQIKHDDGYAIGIDGGASYQAGRVTNVGSTAKTVLKQYPVLAGYNLQGSTNDTIVINFPTAGVYNFEINFAQYINEQTLSVFCGSGSNIIPLAVDMTVGGFAPTSTAFESCGTQPVFPKWTTKSAPTKPSVADASANISLNHSPQSSGWLFWQNLGPTSDLTWKASTNYALAVPNGITDTNGNLQVPYRAGISGTTQPAWSTTLNGLTIDNSNSNLTWIENGPSTSLPANTLSAFTGWEYCICLVNTLNNTVSNAGTTSLSTNKLVAQTGIKISGGLPPLATIDPQCDYVAIFRTTDGEATPFLIPGTGNSIYTIPLSQYIASGYTDTATDQQLNELISAPQSGENTPPPVGAINLSFHLNRVWVSAGNTVYWSTGPDTPVGNGYEGFAPDNFDGMESNIKRIVPLSVGAFVMTVSDIYVILGDGTENNPIQPGKPYLKGIGLLHYDALDLNGSTINMMTADRQVLLLEPSAGTSQVGFPIGNLFELGASWNGFNFVYDPKTAYVTWHVSGSQDMALYVADGVKGWFRLVTTPAPEQGMTWTPFAAITGGVTAVQSVETSPGVHSLLAASSGAGPILKRDLTVNTDNGTAFAAYFVLGSIVLAHPGQIAELDFVTTESVAKGTPPTVSVVIDEAIPYYTGTFEKLPVWSQDPPQLPASTSMFNQRFRFSQGNTPAVCRHLQVRVDWIAENFANELLSLTIFGGYLQEN